MSDTQTFNIELEQREGFEFGVRFDWPGMSRQLPPGGELALWREAEAEVKRELRR